MNGTEKIDLAIKAFTEQISKRYRERLLEIRLYGSRAREEHVKDSDVDLLVILKDFTDFWEEFAKISEYASKISLEFDVVISAIPIGESEWKTRKTPLILNARREGVTVG